MINQKYQKGMTFIEIIIATGLLTILASITTRIMFSLQENNSMMEATNLMKIRDQTALNKIGKEINSAKMFIGRIPTTGTPYQYGSLYYLPKIDLPANFNVGQIKCSPLLVANRILPMIKNDLSFSPLDVGNSSLAKKFDITAVGNTLFFATVKDSINANYVYTADGTNRTRNIDLIQFNYYYLAKSNPLLDSKGKPFLFLMKWQSKYFLNYKQISETLAATSNQTSFINSIKAAKPIGDPSIPITDVWNSDRKDACGTTTLGDNYFYSLGTSGFTNTTCATYKIPMYKNERATLVDGYMNGLTYSIERNNSDSGISQVPKYGQADNTSDNFPNGFEVMVGGDSGSRKIFTRTVRKASKPSGRSVYSETYSLFQGSDS